MKITIWGSRGSIPSPSPDNNRYGGNTSCVQVTSENAFLVLDAGSGIRCLNSQMPDGISRVDILLTHLHMDHIIGLGFFGPLYNSAVTVTIYGPNGTADNLGSRLIRYLSPPLFPIRLHDLPCQLNLIEINQSKFQIGDLTIKSAYVCHPGPTLGYRIESGKSCFTYIPDHEPVLGSSDFPNSPEWTSGYDLAKDADLLFHDAQYTPEEYQPRIGWGHSSIPDALTFAQMTAVKKMMFFHHDPSHSDGQLDNLLKAALKGKRYPFSVGIAAEGDSFILP